MRAPATRAATAEPPPCPGASWTAGRTGGAVNLGGSSGHVQLPAGILGGATAFTVAAWVRLDTVTAWSRVVGRSQYGWDPYPDGQLDNVRVSSRALNAAEISSLYAAGQ